MSWLLLGRSDFSGVFFPRVNDAFSRCQPPTCGVVSFHSTRAHQHEKIAVFFLLRISNVPRGRHKNGGHRT
jgi:hypothetical protein